MVSLTVLCCLCAGAPQAPPPRQYSLKQYMAIKRSTNPSFSPTAAQIAYAGNSSGSWQLWLTSVKGGKPKQMTKFAGGISGCSWSPRGETILVVADKNGDQKYQFFTVDARTGATTQITEGDTQNDFGGWSADGLSIVYTSNARDPKFFDCYVMNVATRKAEMVCQRDGVLHASAISSDGRLIAVEEARSEVDNDLLVVDTVTKSVRGVTPHRGNAKFAAIGFSTDGGNLYYRSNQGREFMAVVAQNLGNGKVSTLIGVPYDLDSAVLSLDGKRIAVTQNIEGFEELSIWDVATRRQMPRPRLAKGIASPQQFSTDGSKLAIVLNTPVHDDEVWLVDCRTGSCSQVTQTYQGGIAEKDLVLAKPIRYKTFDGRLIPALLYVPQNASPRSKAPVILSIHGGPEDQEKPYITGHYQFLVSRGYAVLAPNVRGSTGYGKSYVDLDNGPLRWNALKDLAWAARWIRAQPNLDASKIVGFGPSYGGFSTLAMLAHYPDLFAAGVDFYGPADLKTFLSRTAAYRRPIRIAEYGDPVKDSAFLDAISPAKHADKIKKPLLVVQGANDPIVPKAESEDIVRLVRSQGGTVDYLLLADEGHGLGKEANWVKAFERMLTFLRRHVPAARQKGLVRRLAPDVNGGRPSTLKAALK